MFLCRLSSRRNHMLYSGFQTFILNRSSLFHVNANSSGVKERADPERCIELEEKGKRVTWIGLWSNLGLFGLKGSVGYLSGSASLIADALHSGSDLCSDVVALAAIYVSRLPPSEKHPYGYGHYETVGSLCVAFLLVTAGIGTGNLALEHLIPILRSDHAVPEIDLLPAAAACAGVSVVIKEALYRVTVEIGRESRSPVIIANAWHHRTDSFSSIVALIGIGGYGLGLPYLDPVAGILVSGMIMKAGVQIGWDAIEDLTDRQRPYDEIVDAVEQIGKSLSVETRGEIVDVHNVRVRRLGHYVLVDLHVAVAPTLSVTAAYQAANRVKRRILRQVEGVNEVFAHVQGHPPRSFSSQNGGDWLSFSSSSRKLEGSEESSLADLRKIRTRPQYKIEKDIEKALVQAQQKDILGMTHCLIHYNLNENRAAGNKVELSQVVEVNLVMEKSITLAEAEEAARIAKQHILLIPDICDVDIHVEILPEGTVSYKPTRA